MPEIFKKKSTYLNSGVNFAEGGKVLRVGAPFQSTAFQTLQTRTWKGLWLRQSIKTIYADSLSHQRETWPNCVLKLVHTINSRTLSSSSTLMTKEILSASPTMRNFAKPFVFSKTQNPPVLRITILGPSSAPAPTVSPAVLQPAPKTAVPETPPLKEIEEKENPPLPVSEWEPVKKPIPQESPKEVKKSSVIPQTKRSIAQETNELSIATSQSVSDSSASAAATTSLSSKQILEFVGQDKENDRICSSLSRQIAQDCAELSQTTAQLCETLSRAMSQQSITSSGSIPKELSDLSSSTVSICERLSHETALRCSELSQATTVLNEQAQHQLRASGVLKKQSEELAKLSKATLDECGVLSAATSASSRDTSSNVSSMVKGM